MRIGIDARLLYYRQGGISTYTRCLIQELSALRHDEEYVVIQSRKNKDLLNNLKGIEVARSWTPCHHRFEQIALPIELIPLKLDLLHSPDFIPPFRRRCKSVITVHDLAFLKYPHLLTADSRAYYLQIRKAVNSADAVISVSSSTKSDLIAQLDVPQEKITVIPEAAGAEFKPISDRDALDRVRRRYNLPKTFVLFLGTIEPRKNLSTLIRAYASVVKTEWSSGVIKEQSPRLVIAGPKGWLPEDTFKTVDMLGIDDWVWFAGPILGEDLPALYNLATAFVMPSLYEGFGLPVLEAMACGIPVVASNASSLPEVAGEAAMLVDPFDIDGWAQAVSQVMNDRKLRHDLRQRGLHRSQQFSWRKTALETRALYEKVLGR